MRFPSASKIARVYTLKTAKDLPADVERYVQEGTDSGMDEGKAWAIAWSRYCKYKNPGSGHCKKDESEYFKGRKAAAKVRYVGAMLEDPEKLLSWWENNIGSLLPNKYAHHMTIKFAPSEERVAQTPVGDRVFLDVVGYAENDNIQVVVVQPIGVDSDNLIPHVTVSTDGTPPVKSNILLNGGFTPIQGPKLKARIGLFVDNKEVFEKTPIESFRK